MPDKPSPFAAIFAEEDKLGLLAVKPAGNTRSTEEELALSHFLAINAFIDEHHFLPGSNEDGREPSLNEYALEAHLEAFRGDDTYRSLLAKHDRHGLLGPVAPPLPTNMDEILTSDNPLLETDSENIFDLRHVPEPALSKATAEDIAKRRQCQDFEMFAPIFAQLKADVANGRRVAERFKSEANIKVGTAFVLNGIMVYVAEMTESMRRGRDDVRRIRLIFDNGTESNHLLRSLARLLHDDENGRQIIEKHPELSGPLFAGAPDQIETFGAVAGTVYIVESLSSDPQIAALNGRLYKVGFTTQPVTKRLLGVEKESTFLYAPVHLVQTFDTNFNPQKLEQLLHQFFGNARLQVDISLGKTVSPQEWFVVPLELVEEAVNRILDRSILDYRYDHISRKIVLR